MPRASASVRTAASHSENAGRGASWTAAGAGLKPCATETNIDATTQLSIAAFATSVAQPFRAALATTISVYRLSSARTASRGSRCRHVQYAFHGSRFSFASRPGTVAIVKRSGVRFAESSAHASGVDTGASGFARVENAAIDVFVRLLRR